MANNFCKAELFCFVTAAHRAKNFVSAFKRRVPYSQVWPAITGQYNYGRQSRPLCNPKDCYCAFFGGIVELYCCGLHDRLCHSVNVVDFVVISKQSPINIIHR